MSERLLFPNSGFKRSPRTNPVLNALFFALVPSIADLPRIVGFIRRLRAELGLRGAPLSPECLHVSLFSLGVYLELPQEIVAAAKEAGAKVSAFAIEIILDRAMTFPHNKKTRPFVLRPSEEIAALEELYGSLDLAMRKSGLRRWIKSRSAPHMTMSYDWQVIEERAVEMVRWRASELVLVHSLQGQGKHIHLARWPLH